METLYIYIYIYISKLLSLKKKKMMTTLVAYHLNKSENLVAIYFDIKLFTNSPPLLQKLTLISS
jgi:hypothetical protein